MTVTSSRAKFSVELIVKTTLNDWGPLIFQFNNWAPALFTVTRTAYILVIANHGIVLIRINKEKFFHVFYIAENKKRRF